MCEEHARRKCYYCRLKYVISPFKLSYDDDELNYDRLLDYSKCLHYILYSRILPLFVCFNFHLGHPKIQESINVGVFSR